MSRFAILPLYVSQVRCAPSCSFCCFFEGSREPFDPPALELLSARLDAFAKEQGSRSTIREFALYGGPLEANPSVLDPCLTALASGMLAGQLHGLRIQARPAALTVSLLRNLKARGLSTVELDIPSMSESVLARMDPSHSVELARHAAAMVLDLDLKLGIQLRLGLPGSSHGIDLRSVDRVVNLHPHFVRLHPTLVLSGSSLELEMLSGRYSPLELEETVALCAAALDRLDSHGIAVARVGLQPTRDLGISPGTVIGGPYHPALRSLVEIRRMAARAEALLGGHLVAGCDVTLAVSPSSESDLRGPENSTLKRLARLHRCVSIRVASDRSLQRGSLTISSIVRPRRGAAPQPTTDS